MCRPMAMPCDFVTQPIQVLAAKTACFQLCVGTCITRVLTYVRIGSVCNCDKQMDKTTTLSKVGHHIIILRAASLQCNFSLHTVGGYIVLIKYLLLFSAFPDIVYTEIVK